MTPCDALGIVATSVRVVRSRIEKCELTASSMQPTTAQCESGLTRTLYGCAPVTGIIAASVWVATSTTATASERTQGASAYWPFGVTATWTGRSPTGTVCVTVHVLTSKKESASESLCAMTTAVPFGRNASSCGPSPSGASSQERKVVVDPRYAAEPRGSTRRGFA